MFRSAERLHCVLSFFSHSLSLSLSLSPLSDYYSTEGKLEYIETGRVTKSDDATIRDSLLHVDVRASERACARCH